MPSKGHYGDWQKDWQRWNAGGRKGPEPRESDYTDVDPGFGGGSEGTRRPGTTADSSVTIMRDFLRTYGLGSLTKWALEQLKAYGGTPQGIAAVQVLIRDTDEYKERFKGMEERRRRGLAPLSEAQYVQMEDFFQNAMRDAGIPRGFWDEPDDLHSLIGSGVTEETFTQRVAMAARAAESTNPALKQQLEALYGIRQGEVVAYFLDPERATSVIEQRLQLEAAGMSAASVRSLGQGLNRSTSEQLVAGGFGEREISDRLGQQAGLVGTQTLGEKTALTANEVVASEFGLNPDDVTRVRRLTAARRESARRAGGAAATQGGVVGLGSAQ